MNPSQFFAAQAWVQGAWARDVLLTVDAHGHWCTVQPNATLAQRSGAMLLGGPVLPGVPADHVLDALVFSSPEARFTDVFVAGKPVVSGGHMGRGTHGLAAWQQLKQDYVRTMQQLWA